MIDGNGIAGALGFLEAIFAFLFGLLIGSFLNVCIHRWPRGRSVVRPRSHCVRCRKMIPWYDNIPVLSYILLGGQCRYCKRHISIRYPLVELGTGVLFFYLMLTMGPTGAAIKIAVFASMLWALVFCDLEKRILPDQFTLGGAIVGIGFAFFVPVSDSFAQAVLAAFRYNPEGRAEWLSEAAFGSLVPAAFLWTGGWIYEKVRHREGLGLGDVKLIIMVGAFLGLRSALQTMILGCVAGLIVGYGYIKATHKDASTYELPFGTFLALAGIVVALWGPRFNG